MKRTLLLGLFMSSAAIADHHMVVDAVEGAVVGGVIGAATGDVKTGAAIGAGLSVVAGAFEDVEREEQAARVIEDAIIDDAIDAEVDDAIAEEILLGY